MPAAAPITRIVTRVTTTLALVAGLALVGPVQQAQALTQIAAPVPLLDIAFAPDGTHAYAVGAANASPGKLFKITLADNSITEILDGINNARRVAITHDGARIVASGYGRLYMIDPAAPSLDDSLIVEHPHPWNWGHIGDIAASDNAVYATNFQSGAVARIKKNGGTWPTAASWEKIWNGPGTINSSELAVTNDDSFLLVTSSTPDIFRIDDPLNCSANCPHTSITTAVSSRGIAISPDQTFAYFAQWNGTSHRRIDLGTNTVTTISGDSGQGSRDVAISADGAYAYLLYTGEHSRNPRINKVRTSDNTVVATVDRPVIPCGAAPQSIVTSPLHMSDSVLVASNGGTALNCDPVASAVYRYPTTAQAPTNLVAVAGDDTASISFTPGQDGLSAITNYEYSLDGTNWTALSPADTTSPVTIPGLPNGVAQSISLRTVNGIGSGAASATVSVTPLGPPDPPTITQVDWDDTTASIYFTAPAFDGGSAITTYEYTLDSGANWNNRSDGGGVTSPLVVTGLTTNTTYSIDLRAVNSVGGGTTPPAPVVVTPGAPKTPSAPPPTFPPAPPTSVTAVAGDRSAVVTWQAPENAGSFVITHYQVISTPGSHTCLTTTTTCVVDDLEPGVDYTFTVRGLNGAGWGAASTPSAQLIWPDEQATSILVTGGRTVGRLVAFTGTIGGPMPGSVRPMIALDGEGSPRMGRVVIPAEDGTFTWSRRLSRGATIWFIADEATSTPIEIAATRRASRR